ncbi:MAG: type II toxin-antitoxin system PemK/MazF family toxin [Sulfurovum sp.]|nr:MAG: type II toxin-antitoxin system PemK/MazF family toxin [Sulfurovum sp.]
MNQYDVYLADLNPTIGREQRGKRPILIISNNYENLLDVLTILPITSLKKNRRVYPNEFLLQNELEKPSIVLCQQIRTISKQRLVKKLTTIDNPFTRKDIMQILCRRFEEME